MIAPNDVRFFLARALAKHAARILSARRRDWGQAMQVEIDYIDNPNRALSWAFGCVIASYTERLRIMTTSTLRVSKWLLATEVLVCFGPLTVVWLIGVFSAQQFLGRLDILVDLAFSSLAPVAFLLSLRFLTTNKTPPSAFYLTLAIAFAARALLMLADLRWRDAPLFLWGDANWQSFILFAALPALCCLHLSRFASSPTAFGPQAAPTH